MDSLSQALLGASTFALVKDKQIGNSALVIGAVVGTIPDLDVFLAPFFNEIAFITVHRSLSHSLLFAVLGSLLMACCAHRITKYQYRYRDWTLAFFLALFTHTLLDWCTTYGTKILCPFNGHLFSFNNIHVLEPIYTTILLVGVLVLAFRKHINRAKVINWTLGLSTLYLGWSFVSKGIANHQFVQEIEARNIQYEKMLISPTPFNTLLWNGIIKTENGYYFGSYSLLDSRNSIELHFIESNNQLLSEIKKYKKGRQYLEYTQDFPLIAVEDELVKVYAIKYGPINYFGAPEFVHPLCLNLDEKEESIVIVYSPEHRGPLTNYKQLLKRIKGI